MTAGRMIHWYVARKIPDVREWGPAQQSMSQLLHSESVEQSFNLMTAGVVQPDGSTIACMIVSTPFSVPPDWLVLTVEHILLQHGLTDEVVLPVTSETALFNWIMRNAARMAETAQPGKHAHKLQNLHGVPVNEDGEIITTERSN